MMAFFKRFGAFHKQSKARKALNILGLCLAMPILLEVVLRILGFVVSLQILHVSNLWSGKQASEYVILCIGDSWTVGEQPGNYPGDLQKTLQPLLPATKLRVINLGYGGANSSQGVRRLAAAIPQYHPNMVLVLIGNNDHWNLSESAYWQFTEAGTHKFALIQAKTRVFLHSLRVYKLGKILYAKLRGLPTPNQFYYFSPEDPNIQQFEQTAAIDRDIHHRQLEYNLIQFIELAQLNNVQLVLQTYFHFHGYQVNEIIRDVALAYHIPLVDHNVFFHQQIPEDQRQSFLIADGHPNAAGYQFIADNIVRVLQEKGLLQHMSVR